MYQETAFNHQITYTARYIYKHVGGKWLIHDTKRRKDNQLQSLEYFKKLISPTNFTHLTGVIVWNPATPVS